MTHPKDVLRAVSVATGIPERRLRGPLRHQRFARPRFVAALVMRWEGWSLNEIGAELGGRDHSTVRSAAWSALQDIDLLATAADVAVRCELERGLGL